MKFITRHTDYAIRAICYIAEEKNRIVSAQEIVSKLKIPYPFLRGLLQILHKRGILSSFKGKNGGFMLKTPSRKILLIDLIEIFQGPLKLNECFFKKRICPDRNNCALRQKINLVEKNVVSELKSITVASLLSKGS